MNENDKKEKRKIVLMFGSRLQRRYLRIVILSLIIPTFITGGCLYYLIFSLIAQEIAIPEFISLTLFPAISKINIILIITLPLIFLAIFVIALIVSHRLVGPIGRLTKDLEDIYKGNHSKRLLLRRDDDLKPIADSINKLLDKFGGRH